MVAQDCHANTVVVDRGNIVENTHIVHCAVVDSSGKLLLSLGNPHRVTLLRSAAKPAQALTILESGAFEAFGYDDADLALMCGSYNAEDLHIQGVRKILSACSASESDLVCGGHASLIPQVNREWIQQGFEPTAGCSNCSAKHAGMLAAARVSTAAFDGYHLQDHPVQQRMRKTMQELCGEQEVVLWALDGCNAPAPAMSLFGMGKMFAAFSGGADINHNATVAASAGEQSLARTFRAMTTYPYLIGGKDRYDTLLMEAYKGKLIGKIGADGCYCVGVRASEETRRLGAEGAIGIALKVEDGNLDVVYASTTEILRLLRIGTDTQRSAVDAWNMRTKKNTAGAVIGGARFDFEWKRYA